MPNEIEVAELWLAFQKGDKGAYNTLVSLFYRTLYNYGTKLTPHTPVVEDCIQELFLDIWRRRTFLGATEHVKFYLLKALRRKIFLELKTLNKWPHQPLQEGEELDFIGEFSVESQIIESETNDFHNRKLGSVLQKLSKRQREVIYLKFYQEMDYEQIAGMMSINYQSVRNLIHTAIKDLQQAWFLEQ